MEKRRMTGQDRTDVFQKENGLIGIQQWNEQDGEYSTCYFDPLFVPILISWLFELIAPEAVG